MPPAQLLAARSLALARSHCRTGAAVTAERDVAEKALDLALAAVPGADVEVTADRTRLALTRFANSVIHQNVAEDTTSVRVRIHLDGRTAAGSTTLTDETGLAALVGRTADAVRVAPLDPGWPGLAPPSAAAETATVDAATVDASPDVRASMVRAFVDAAGGLEAAGFCRTSHWRGAFMNSAGHELTGESAEASLDGIARGAGVDGVARIASNRVADLDGAVLGARAAAKVRAGADPIELPPGHYEVVLEPAAVADLLQNLAVWCFAGKAVNERRSFAEVGATQFDPAVNLVDDPLSAGDGYDGEGTPHRRLPLVEAGTTVAVCHDRRTSVEAGTTSTGNATGFTAWGALPLHLQLLPPPGEATVTEIDGPVADSAAADLVAGVARGVLVSDFWYTRVLDPKALAITGLTRNGVWLIENGEVTRPLRNFRFTQSYAQALAPDAVRGVGGVAVSLPDSWVGARWTAPALHLASWNFTGGASG
jgi:predicted Zn-dependent protease